MKANELRLRNFVLFEDKPYIIYPHDIEYLDKNPDSNYHKPIPLTEEWILILGCKGSNGRFNTPNRTELLFHNNEVHFMQDNGQSYFGEIFFVHEFQNAVFVVDKQELELHFNR